MPNLRGLLATLLTDRIPKLALQSITAVLSGALLIFAIRKWQPGRAVTKFDLQFSLSIVVTVLISYHAFAYDLCLLLIPILLIANYLQGPTEFERTARLMLLGPVFVLFLSPLLMLLWLHYGQLNLLALVLGVWAWGIAREISRASQTAPSISGH